MCLSYLGRTWVNQWQARVLLWDFSETFTSIPIFSAGDRWWRIFKVIFFFHEASHFPQKINCRAPFQVAPCWCCLGFPGGSEVKASACNVGDLGSIPGSGRSPGEGNDNPLQYSCLENPMDGGASWAIVHGVAKSQTRLSDFTFTLLSRKFARNSQILSIF